MGTRALVRTCDPEYIRFEPFRLTVKFRNQWDLLGAILDRYWSPGSRCAVALCAFCWAFYYLGINVAANMLPFGSDATMLMPRLITIPRGNYICVLCAFVTVPWKILSSAAVFTQFLSGYGIFMVRQLSLYPLCSKLRSE